MIVDDEPEIVGFITELLTHRGYEVRGLSDSREAFGVFQSFHPDLCILDFRMPFVSGSIILDTVKRADSTVEVIFLTAQDETSLAVDLMKRGAIDFLLKPVELNQLSMSVARALEHRRLIKENEAYKLLWKDDWKLREMVSRALNHNYANNPGAFPAQKLDAYRFPPRPTLKAAPPPP